MSKMQAFSNSPVKASAMIGTDVVNPKGDNLGDVKEVVIDPRSGRVAYAVVSFGGFLGMGEKLFAVPWKALTLDTENKRFILNVEKDRLKQAPGFNKDHWPNMADQAWENEIHSYWIPKQYSELPKV